MSDLIHNWWFIWWEWEKNPEIYKNTKTKTKEKIPRLVALPSPIYKNVRKHRKQAGPTLGGAGILV